MLQHCTRHRKEYRQCFSGRIGLLFGDVASRRSLRQFRLEFTVFRRTIYVDRSRRSVVRGDPWADIRRHSWNCGAALGFLYVTFGFVLSVGPLGQTDINNATILQEGAYWLSIDGRSFGRFNQRATLLDQRDTSPPRHRLPAHAVVMNCSELSHIAYVNREEGITIRARAVVRSGSCRKQLP